MHISWNFACFNIALYWLYIADSDFWQESRNSNDCNSRICPFKRKHTPTPIVLVKVLHTFMVRNSDSETDHKASSEENMNNWNVLKPHSGKFVKCSFK
jgi:hypothetical protein